MYASSEHCAHTSALTSLLLNMQQSTIGASGSLHQCPQTSHPKPIALPTGQKVYDLDVSSAFGFFWCNRNGQVFESTNDFHVWNDDRFMAICNYMANPSPSAAEIHAAFPEALTAFLVKNHSSQPPISHQLLKSDGFFLGEFIKCVQDQDVCNPSQFAVFEVPSHDLLFSVVSIRLMHDAETLIGPPSRSCSWRIRRVIVSSTLYFLESASKI